MILFFIFIFWLFQATSGDDKVWAVLGRPLALNCQSSDETCLWLNPDKKTFVRSNLEQKVKFSDVDCNIEVRSVEETDIGAWTCLAGNQVEDVVDVLLALEPGSVQLETVSDSEVRCVVARARPRPKFDWYLDDVLLHVEDIIAKDFEGGEKKKLKTLSFKTNRFFKFSCSQL